MQLLQQDQATISQKQSAWNDIQSKLQAVQTAIQNLQAPAAAAGKIGTITPPSGQTAPFTVTASPAAAQGTYSVTVNSLATTASLSGKSGIANPISTATATNTSLTGEGFGTTPTLGTVTINGQSITIDSGTTLLHGAGTDSIQDKISAIAGLSFSYSTDGSGNVTGVTISAASGVPIQLGAAGDTSNLLTALHLTSAVPVAGPPYSVTSNGTLSGISLNTSLTSAGLAGAFNSSGSFAINGVTITYGTTDSLGSLIGQINNSKAGVTATYDALSDRVTLTANTTGTGGISVTDPNNTGLPAALGLMAGSTSTAGMPASITVSGINGGNPIASASNTVTGVIPGMTLNLTAKSVGGPSTVTVGPDTTSLTNALQGFVTAYNSALDTISKYNNITLDQTGATQSVGILAGDPSLSSLTTQLDEIVNDTSVTVGGQSFSLSALGISTGAPGSFVPGQAVSLDLQFNSSAVTSALSTTPTLGQAFIGTGSVSSQQGTLFQALYQAIDAWTSPLGNVGTSLDALSADYSNDQQAIQNWQDQITAMRSQLSDMFTNMETSLSTVQAQGQALSSALGFSLPSTGSSGGGTGSGSSSGG